MTDESSTDEVTDEGSEALERAVESFLNDVETALDEYDEGYADADATLRVLRSHLKELREAADV